MVGRMITSRTRGSRSKTAAKSKAKTTAALKKPYPLKDGSVARFRVLAGSEGRLTGSKVDAVLESSTSVTLTDGSVVEIAKLFPLDERALMLMEVAAVWRAVPSLSMRDAYQSWKKDSQGR
jgi:hypothetical protein